ncbi:acetyl-CoA:acetoacetyl-CoA transferase subunit beta [Escherichia coli]|uniref:Acetyl-CoA:acetoacetyl-CoA transferase subunit beta n=1 Tax=Escherichia coli TaxID=562 RepID=A0A484YDP0_ECOLX|nr:acetyl-CoA:acetoacetyl-CoA transferase subunit beta [Escherichia coli]
MPLAVTAAVWWEADHIMAAIEERFLQTGHPRDLTLIHSLGIGDRDSKGTNRFAHAEMLKRIIAGHFTWSPKMQELVKSNAIEAYCFPGGVIQGTAAGDRCRTSGTFYPRWAGIRLLIPRKWRR